MCHLRRSLKNLCLAGSLVCLFTGSYCFAVCIGNGNGHNGPCYKGHFHIDRVAGSYADMTPVCASWSEITCLNVYVPQAEDNNGLDAVAIVGQIEIFVHEIVGDSARTSCGGSKCDGCPPARPGNTGGYVYGVGQASAYKKCCVPDGTTNVIICPMPPGS